MISIIRYKVPSYRDKNTFELQLHEGSQIVHVDQIKVPEKEEDEKERFEYYLWALQDSSKTRETRRFWFVRDGDDLAVLGEDALMYHVGSFRSIDGRLWCHVFEITDVEITEVKTFEPEHRKRQRRRT